MKTFEITKEQIRELVGSSFTCEKYLKELFPEAFEPELKTGIWYKSNNNSNNIFKNLFLFIDEINTDTIKGYGFNENGIWIELDCLKVDVIIGKITPATEQEVFERLNEEAVKRGFKKGVTVDRYKLQLHPVNTGNIVKIESDCFSYDKGYFKIDCYSIFSEGKWAEICITKEEAEKELGKKII